MADADAPVKRVPILSLFADVREGEGWSAIVLTLNVFLLLCAYYLLKVAREPLILMGGGAAVKSYASAGQALILAGLTPLYGVLASRLSRIKLITTVTLFFVANLVVFIVMVKAGAAVGVPFYLWVGIFNMMVIAQFWAFAADIFTNDQGKRIFPVVGIGSTFGAIAGSWLARALFKSGATTISLMSAAAALLGVSLVLTIAVNRRTSRNADAAALKDAEAPIEGPNGFKLVFGDRYLLGITALAIIINCVNSTGEFLLDSTLLGTAATEAKAAGVPLEAFIGSFKADYFLAVNVTVTVVQMFIVSRVIKHLGLAFALVIVPVVSVAGYLAVAVAPVLAVVFAVKVAENSLDYSLQNTARQTLWLVTPRVAKYKAKVIIDTLFVRGGDVLSGGVTLLATRLALGTAHVAPINAALACLWLGAAYFVGRENKKRVLAADALPAGAPA